LESVDLDDRSSKSKKKDKSVERLRKSSMLKSLREELGDAPLAMKSIGADADLEAASDSDAEDERERRAYEEDHFTRLALTRKDKRKEKDRKKRATLGDGLEDLEDFADLAALDDAVARAQEDKIESTRKAEALRAALKSVDDEERKTKSSRRSGDVDLAPRLPNQPLPKPNSSKKRAVPEDESDIEDDMAGPALSEDEMYMAAEAATRDRKKAKKADDKERKKQAKTKEVFLHSEDDEVDDEDEKRKASDKIIKNRGLTAYRSKEDRNPRVKLRKKFDKASKKHRSIVRPMREKSDVYSGESHGIKKNVSRSVSLGQRR
jgi:U3 small nucleolar RNA-associated protein 3